MLRLCALALCAVVAVLLLAPEKNGSTVLVSIIATVVMAVLIVGQVTPIMDFINELKNIAGLADSTVLPLFKVVGISFVTKITADICIDAGEKGLAAKLEMAGTVLSIVVTLPLFSLSLQLVSELL